MILVAILIGILVPLQTSAKESTIWDFRNPLYIEGWESRLMDKPEQTPMGLVMRTSKEGGIVRTLDLRHNVDAVTITLQAPTRTEVRLAWHSPGTPEDTLVQFPFVVDPTPQAEEVRLNVSFFEEWHPRIDRIGIIVPAGSDVLLESVRLEGWNGAEKVLEGVKSFFTFDDIASYSINFLWGPLLAFNPVAREQLYAFQPPRAWSANRVLYAGIAVSAIILIIRNIRQRSSVATRSAWLLFLAICAGAWMVYDLRMGAELLSYAFDDVRTYWSEPPPDRVFRGDGGFRTVIEESMAKLRSQPRYGLYLPKDVPFDGLARYLTYPSRPLQEGENTAGVRTWLTFAINGITLSQSGQLMLGGTVLTPPGQILRHLPNDSILFEASP